MPLPQPTIPDALKLRTHLQHTLEDLPNNLPHFDEARLLGKSRNIMPECTRLRFPDDLTSLLRSPLYLYTISPRLTNPNPAPPSTYLPPSPVSITDCSSPDTDAFTILHLSIRIKWSDKTTSWATQLCYNSTMLLEGRELNANRESGFMRSFGWFCEEVGFLAREFGARDLAFGVSMGREREKGKRRSLKLKIRFGKMRTATGEIGVWRVD
ncbi:hypothetical protein CC86DRAFT_293755 [Ophiobolus disseminans]|uniref:Uncharacterized protein n=1 Tax=Ophiobolus disseminans TaxID=1469910 RepID=A0A6A6ZZJ5_9PLEO|nr:hypothetical protein CC86DRAFT_293755 [Ophiobolus disseminans]